MRFALGKAARTLLSPIYREGKVYPVLSGPLRGARFQYDRTVNLSFLLGTAEKRAFDLLGRYVAWRGANEQLSFCDTGANMGWYSLFFAQATGPQSKIYAFEPSPTALPKLEANLQANPLLASKIEIVPKACGAESGTVEFFVSESHYTSSVVESWSARGDRQTQTIEVPMVSLDEFFTAKAPDLIKMDIEGGGVYALAGAKRCLGEGRSFVWMESHTPQEDRAVIEALKLYEYVAFRVHDGTRVQRPDCDYSHPDGVRGAMFLVPREHANEFDGLLG